jgi:rod shape determining protein RodA
MFRREVWRNFDYWLFGAVAFLCIFGIMMIRSAIAGNTDLADSPSRQALFVGVGLVLILVLSLIDYRYWASLTRVLYVFAIVFLMLIFVFAQARFGAARWLNVGTFLIQPAEIGKIVMILVLANYFSNHQDSPKNLRWIFGSLISTLFMVLWILLQPNLSTSIVIMVIWFAMLWISGLPAKYLIVFIIALVLLAAVIFPFLQEYQQARILTFFFPEQNARYGNTYNVDQALVSIGSGGLFGEGYGHGTQVQLRFLKVRHSDFIFSSMAEEFGFVGTAIVVALMIFVVSRCFRAARLARDQFGALIAYGFGVLIFFQMAVNIGVNLNLMPVTGLTLPFISYGGSSLISLAIGIGLVESIVVRKKL